MFNSETAASRLAICGGTPIITAPWPHAKRSAFEEGDIKAVNSYLASEQPISCFGREGIIGHYEQDLAKFFGRKYCILTNSGTSALYSAYFGLKLGLGDEVLVPSMTFMATVTPLLQLGAIPVFVDSDETGNISLDDVERKLTSKTKAVAVTHLWGLPVDMQRLRAIVRNVPILEDVSLAVGSTRNDVLAGTAGTVACLSLGSTKLISGGQGGALLTDDEEVFSRATLVGHFAKRSYESVKDPFYRQFASTGYGHNFRIHVLAAAISRQRFLNLSYRLSLRHKRFNRLSAGLRKARFVSPPVTPSGTFRGSWQGYCARFDYRAAGVTTALFARALRAEGAEVFAGAYHAPLHSQAVFVESSTGLPWPCSHGSGGDDEFPGVTEYVRSSLSFPLFFDEPLDLIDQYLACINKVEASIEELRRIGGS